MGHSYNDGLHTSSKGITYDAVKVSGLDTTPCTILEDCKSGLITGVTRAVTGEYLFQLSKPYPPKVVAIIPHLTAAATTSAMLLARYKDSSYDATLGQFTILVSDNSSGSAVATNAASTNRLHVHMAFNRYTN